MTGKKKVLAVVAAVLLVLSQGGALAAEPSWRTSFEETCARSNEAMTLSVGELTALLERCVTLEKAIQQEEESVRKVYLKRLQLCRNLYAYVLDYKKNSESAK
ncbi:MAG TPA: hypothetical protein VJ550_09375 [Geomonas sp.]|nr:hypothetical protein [Geomonas sp.]